MPMVTMPAIELNRVPRQKSPHDIGYGRTTGAQQQVNVVGY